MCNSGKTSLLLLLEVTDRNPMKKQEPTLPHIYDKGPAFYAQFFQIRMSIDNTAEQVVLKQWIKSQVFHLLTLLSFSFSSSFYQHSHTNLILYYYPGIFLEILMIFHW